MQIVSFVILVVWLVVFCEDDDCVCLLFELCPTTTTTAINSFHSVSARYRSPIHNQHIPIYYCNSFSNEIIDNVKPSTCRCRQRLVLLLNAENIFTKRCRHRRWRVTHWATSLTENHQFTTPFLIHNLNQSQAIHLPPTIFLSLLLRTCREQQWTRKLDDNDDDGNWRRWAIKHKTWVSASSAQTSTETFYIVYTTIFSTYENQKEREIQWNVHRFIYWRLIMRIHTTNAWKHVKPTLRKWVREKERESENPRVCSEKLGRICFGSDGWKKLEWNANGRNRVCWCCCYSYDAFSAQIDGDAASQELEWMADGKCISYFCTQTGWHQKHSVYSRLYDQKPRWVMIMMTGCFLRQCSELWKHTFRSYCSTSFRQRHVFAYSINIMHKRQLIDDEHPTTQPILKHQHRSSLRVIYMCVFFTKTD